QCDRIIGAAFTPDGRSFLTTAADGTTRVWPVPVPLPHDLDRLTLKLQVDTCMQMDSVLAVTQLNAPAWQERRQRLQDLAGASPSPGRGPARSRAGEDATWHDARARDAEQDGD